MRWAWRSCTSPPGTCSGSSPIGSSVSRPRGAPSRRSTPRSPGRRRSRRGRRRGGARGAKIESHTARSGPGDLSGGRSCREAGVRNPQYSHGDAQTLRPAAPAEPSDRRYVVVVATVSDLDVRLPHQGAVGRIEADPAAARQIRLDPGMRGIRPEGEARARLEVSADIARGNADPPAQGEHGVRVVLADAGARADELVHG